MSELLLINPRRVKRRKSRKGRMPAGLRRYWASKRRGSAAPKRRRRRAVAVVRRRRRRAVVGTVRRRRANPRRRASRRFVASHRRRRHRNPRIMGSMSGIIKGTVMPAATGAVGGLVLDIVYGKISPMLPAALQTGIPAFAAKAGAAVGLGMLAGKFVGRDKAKVATIGAVTVLFYGMMKSYLATAVPSLGLSGFQDFVTYSGQPGKVGAYMPRGMGAYMSRGLGTLNPAAYVNTKIPGSNMSGYDAGYAQDNM